MKLLWFIASLVLVNPCLAAQTGAIHSESIHEVGGANEEEEDEHAALHGGYFGDADDLYHYELLITAGGGLILYVNDEHNQPLDTKNLEGRWVLDPDSDQPTQGTLVSAYGDKYLTGFLPIESNQEFVHLEVAVLKDGQWAALEFQLPVPQIK